MRANSFKLMSKQSQVAARAAGRAVDVSADDFEDGGGRAVSHGHPGSEALPACAGPLAGRAGGRLHPPAGGGRGGGLRPVCRQGAVRRGRPRPLPRRHAGADCAEGEGPQPADIASPCPAGSWSRSSESWEAGEEEAAWPSADRMEELGFLNDAGLRRTRWSAITPRRATASGSCGTNCTAGGCPGSCGTRPWRGPQDPADAIEAFLAEKAGRARAG